MCSPRLVIVFGISNARLFKYSQLASAYSKMTPRPEFSLYSSSIPYFKSISFDRISLSQFLGSETVLERNQMLIMGSVSRDEKHL